MRSERGKPLAHRRHNTLGLVMAAGFSRRFGREDKRTAQLADGSPLLERTLSRLQPAFTTPSGCCLLAVVIRPEDSPEALGIPPECMILRAPNAALGLGSSIADALHAVQQIPSLNHIDSVAITPGDMPAIRPVTVTALLAYASADTIVRPRYREQPGHPVLFGRRFWAELRAINGGPGARQVIAANRRALVVVDVDDPGVVLDIDTRAALENEVVDKTVKDKTATSANCAG